MEKEPDIIKIARGHEQLSYRDLERMSIKDLSNYSLIVYNMPARLAIGNMNQGHAKISNQICLFYGTGIYVSGKNLDLSSPAPELLKDFYEFAEFIFNEIKSRGKLN